MENDWEDAICPAVGWKKAALRTRSHSASNVADTKEPDLPIGRS